MSEEPRKIEENDESQKFDVENAIKESREFVADVLLIDAENNKPLFFIQQPTINPDGSITLICVSDIDDEVAVVHTIMSGRVNSDGELVDENGELLYPEETKSSDIITTNETGKIYGIDGSVLN